MLASLVNAHVHCCLEKKKKQAILMVTNRAKLKKKYSTMAYSTALIKSEVCQWVLASKAVHGILLYC